MAPNNLHTTHAPDVFNWVWDTATSEWVKETQGSGGGGGGATTIADGADVTQGAKADVAWVSGDGTVISLLKKIASAGGSAVSIADGSDVAEGATADAAVVTDTTGTVSGKLRGLVKIFASVWDSTLGRLKTSTVGSIRTTSGVLTLNGDTLSIDTTGMATVTAYNTLGAGGFDGNAGAQGSNDGGVNWTTLYTLNDWNGFGAPLTFIPNGALGSFIWPVSGYDTFRLILAGRTVGAGTFALQASPIPWTFPRSIVTVEGAGGNGVVVDAGGGMRVSVANQFLRALPYDGLHDGTIRAASTAAVATDTALVVAVSPNNTPVLPADASTATLQQTVVDWLSGASGTIGVQDILFTNTVFAAGGNAPNALSVQGTAGMVPLSVSGGLTDTQLRATPVPVSGTVTANAGSNLNTSALALDATQTNRSAKAQITDGTRDGTVKAASTLPLLTDTAVVTTQRDPLPAGTNVIGHVIHDTGSTTAVTGTVTVDMTKVAGTATDTNSGVKSAGTLRVVLATDQPALTNKLLVTPDSVALPANQSVNVAQFGASNISTGTGAGGAGIPRVTVSNDSNVLVTPPTLTKATQGATGFSTQDLKDAGRTSIAITATVASTATGETLITVNKSSGLAGVVSAASQGITTGKRLRIQAISISARNSTGTTASNVTVNLRAAAGGATTASSPLQMHFMVALPASTVSTLFPTILIPDGFEIDANGATNTYGLTITHPQWVTGSVVATFDITLIGYEY